MVMTGRLTAVKKMKLETDHLMRYRLHMTYGDVAAMWIRIVMISGQVTRGEDRVRTMN